MSDKSFKDYAPTISAAGVTKTYCDGVELKTPPAPAPEPKLTKTKVQNIIAEFADIESANGIIKIARKYKVFPHQVKTLYREFKLLKSLSQSVETPTVSVETPTV